MESARRLMASAPGMNLTSRGPDGLVTALRPLKHASPWVEAWRALSRRALVDNLFYEPDFCIAAGDAFGAGVGILTVGDRTPEQPGARLLAAWPCRIVYRWGLPIPLLTGWMHDYAIFGAPLLDRDQPARALEALLEAPQRLGLPQRMLLPFMPLDGPLAALMTETLTARGLRRADYWAHERGFLDLGARDATARADYLAARLSRRRSRQLARFSRRLSIPGPWHLESVREPDALPAALSDYIGLEGAGWKGRAGTAILHHPEETEFLRRLVERYGPRGELRIDRLRRDGKSLAASIGLRTGGSFWYLKIAHDEAEARNSPGTQLLLRVTQELLADPTLAVADSCAPAGLQSVDRLWAERRPLAHALIEAEGGDPLFSLAMRLERARAWAARTRRRLATG